MKKLMPLILAAVLGSAITFGGSYFLMEQREAQEQQEMNERAVKAAFTNYNDTAPIAGPIADFTLAAEKTLPTVVHIRSTKEVAQRGDGFGGQLPELFRDFFGDRFRDMNPQQQPGQPFKQQGSGSGVIISPDGYIVTNNHVVDEATEIQVTLNDNRIYTAEVVGVDPSTDLALIKIDAANLKNVAFANSDAIRVGEWVLAVGNPFNLASTVTAGIVSAKGRNINILQGQAPIESFIQTDAAVNPGNSGGALVNLNGDLIGINTAIASPTGSYSGYAFAVPSNIVRKVVDDLKEFGVAQRAYLGAVVRTMDSNLAKELNTDVTQGVYINEVTEDGAAASAGLQKGDIVTSIDGRAVATSSALIETIGRHRPGDNIVLKVIRDGNDREINVKLKNKSGTAAVVQNLGKQRLEALGASFKNTREGVEVTGISSGMLKENTNMRNGFIIQKVNEQPVKDIKALEQILGEHRSGGVMIEGKYPGEEEPRFYAFGLS